MCTTSVYNIRHRLMGSDHLYRRPNGIFQYKRRWPEEVRDLLESAGHTKGWFVKSTGERDRRRAQVKAISLAQDFEDILENLSDKPIVLSEQQVLSLVGDWLSRTQSQLRENPGRVRDWRQRHKRVWQEIGETGKLTIVTDPIVQEISERLGLRLSQDSIDRLSARAFSAFDALYRVVMPTVAGGDFNYELENVSFPELNVDEFTASQEQRALSARRQRSDLEQALENNLSGKKIAPETAAKRRNRWRRFCNFVGSGRVLASIRRDEIEAFAEQLKADGLTAKTINGGWLSELRCRGIVFCWEM